MTIRELRIRTGLSQRALAAAAGVSFGTVQRADTGGHITLVKARKICAVLEIPLEDVVGLEVYSVIERSIAREARKREQR